MMCGGTSSRSPRRGSLRESWPGVVAAQASQRWVDMEGAAMGGVRLGGTSECMSNFSVTRRSQMYTRREKEIDMRELG